MSAENHTDVRERIELSISQQKRFSVNLGSLVEREDGSGINISLFNDADQAGSSVNIDVFTEDMSHGADVGSLILEQLHVSSFTLDGIPLGWDVESLQQLTGSVGAVCFSGTEVTYSSDPARGTRGQVLKIGGPGYGVSIEDEFSIPLAEIGVTDITLDWLESASSCGAAPGDLFAVVKDTTGTSRLVYHTADYQARPSATRSEWRTIDIGRELGLAGSPSDEYSPHYNWLEIGSESKTYPAPINGGITGDVSADARATAAFDEEATLEAVGIGNGSFIDSGVREIYYDSLCVKGTRATPKPLTLHDIATLGPVEHSSGIPTDSTKELSLELSLEHPGHEAFNCKLLTVEVAHER